MSFGESCKLLSWNVLTVVDASDSTSTAVGGGVGFGKRAAEVGVVKTVDYFGGDSLLV
jgi:hypothetical protein